MSVPLPRWRRRLAIGLLALGWLTQQLGFAAHGEIQRRMAAGAGFGEICTGAGLVRASSDAPVPAEHAASGSNFCDVCVGAAFGALVAPATLAFHARAGTAAVESAGPPALALAHPQSAHRPRAPPALLS